MSVKVNDRHSMAANDDLTPFAVGDGLRSGLPCVPRKTK